MANEIIAKAGMEKELEALEIVLAAKVGRSAIALEEYIALRQAQGASIASIREALLVDLETGGRLFGEFTNALKPTFAGSVSRFRDIGELSEVGIDKMWRWVAVLVNTCPDCLERHNVAKTYAEWEIEGLPRTGATVCGSNCKCVLIPEEIAEAEPIYRDKK